MKKTNFIKCLEDLKRLYKLELLDLVEDTYSTVYL